MKTKILLISILTIFLTGCQEDSVPNTQPQSNTPNQEALSETDQAFYAGALRLNDREMCNKIINKEASNLCLEEIQNREIIDSAVENLDTQECDKIENEDTRTACKTMIEVENKLEEQNIEEIKIRAEQTEKAQEISDANDHTRCKELHPDFVRDCEVNILANNAIQNNDITECDKASPENVETCKLIANDVLNTPEIAPSPVI